MFFSKYIGDYSHINYIVSIMRHDHGYALMCVFGIRRGVDMDESGTINFKPQVINTSRTYNGSNCAWRRMATTSSTRADRNRKISVCCV